MANTLTNMQSRIFADSAVREYNALLIPIAAFAQNFNAEAARKGDVVRVPVFPVTTAIPFAGTYAAPDSTIVGTDITLNNHSFKSVAFTDREIAESDASYFENMGMQAGKSVAKAVLDQLFGLVTLANYTNVMAGTVATGVNVAKVADLVGALGAAGIAAPDASLVLNGASYTNLIKDTALLSYAYGSSDAIKDGKIPTLFGLNGVYMAPTLPADGARLLVGFSCAPQAVGVAMRYLMPQSQEGLIDAGSASDDVTGAVLGFRVIPEPLAGKVHYVAEALWGGVALDKKAMVRLATT